MKKRKETEVDNYVLEVLTNAGLKGDELTAQLIIWKQFYNNVKPFMTRMSAEQIKSFAGKFLLFSIEYETIIIRSCRPLTGSQSSAKDIIRMYSAREMNQLK